MSTFTMQPVHATQPPGFAQADQSTATRPRLSRRIAADLVGIADVVAVLAGSFVPALIYANSGSVPANWVVLIQSALVTAVIVYGCLRNWNMYDTTRLNDFPVEPTKLMMALGLSALAVLGLGLPFKPAEVHMWVWYGAWLTASFTFILGARILARSILESMTSAGRFDTRIAVFGAGPVARTVHDYLARNSLGIHLAGVFDDRLGTERHVEQDARIDGTLSELIDAGRNGKIDQIIIALPQSADRRIAMIAARLEQLPVSIHIVTHMASDIVDAGPAHKVSSLGAVGLLDVKSRPLADWSPLVKRVEDYVLATLLLAVTLPLFAVIALAIQLESGGPVLFRQRRRGLNHTVIEVLKFRTMTVAQDDDRVDQATANDPRVTRVGRILRRSSLDELPQLFNVLRGEMSLVGPRPHALVHDEKWGEELETYANRHQVKPGITGLAQVNGWRGEVRNQGTIQARVDEDLNYIRNWSLWLDLTILVRTVAAVVFPRNAH